MKYLGFVGTEGRMPKEAVETMNREFPAYMEELSGRDVRLYGRELDLPDSAVTVRVRAGQTLVADGPFAETKEFVGGFDVLDCANLDEAIEVEGKSPVAKFLPMEIRPFRGDLWLGPAAAAFGAEDDSAGTPYLLAVWMGKTPAEPLDDEAVRLACDAWRQQLTGRGSYVLGGELDGPETATTLRYRDGELRLSDGSFLDSAEFIASLDVVVCADQQQAIDLAATHPLARDHAVEARPFYTEAIHAERQRDKRG